VPPIPNWCWPPGGSARPSCGPCSPPSRTATIHGPSCCSRRGAIRAGFSCESLWCVSFDVSRVRAAYPALDDGYAYLDGAAGTQVPATVIEAIAAVYRSGIGNAGGAFPASGRADAIVAECRRALADLTGAELDGVILGPNMTTLTYRLAD